MWRFAIALVACSSPSAPTPVAPAPVLTGPIPATKMLARVSYQHTNTWVDIAVDGTDDTARKWCRRFVQRLEAQRIDPLKLVVERPCEPTRLPAIEPGWVLEDRRELDVLAIAALRAPGPDDKPPTGTTTHYARFTSLMACQREQQLRVDAAAKAQVEADAMKRQFLERERIASEQRAKRICDDAATQKSSPCVGDPGRCAANRKQAEISCLRERDRASHLSSRELDPSAPHEPPPCLEFR
jgi:hypothetical protein